MFQKLTFSHVKDHQNNKTPYPQLTFDAQLNVDLDKLATDYLKNISTNQSQVSLYLSTKYLLFINSISIISKLKSHIRTAISLSLYKKQLNKTIKWPFTVWLLID